MFSPDDEGCIGEALFVCPGMEEVAERFRQFICEYGDKESFTENMRGRLMRSAFSYMFENVCSEGQTYRAFVYPKSESAKEYRRDLEKIKRHTEALLNLFLTTKAGRRLLDKSPRSHMMISLERQLEVLHRAATEALDDLSPPGGRNRSRERDARIRLVAELMCEAKRAGARPGTGDTGPFPDMIRQIYELLKLDGTERNLTRDLADARKLLHQNRQTGQL